MSEVLYIGGPFSDKVKVMLNCKKNPDRLIFYAQWGIVISNVNSIFYKRSACFLGNPKVRS